MLKHSKEVIPLNNHHPKVPTYLEAQKNKKNNLENPKQNTKCEVQGSIAVLDFWNMYNCGITATDSRYCAKVHATSEAQKWFRLGWITMARSRAGRSNTTK